MSENTDLLMLYRVCMTIGMFLCLVCTVAFLGNLQTSGSEVQTLWMLGFLFLAVSLILRTCLSLKTQSAKLEFVTVLFTVLAFFFSLIVCETISKL